jgi:hypothetical protein
MHTASWNAPSSANFAEAGFATVLYHNSSLAATHNSITTFEAFGIVQHGIGEQIWSPCFP